MKNIIPILLFSSMSFFSKAQQTLTYSILVDSVLREFILYIPKSYNGTSRLPLVLSFHGLGGNAQAQMEDHDFRPVADTAEFIVAHPLGAPIIGQSIRGWNFGNNALPDDVLFTSKIIDTIAANFNIDLDRVYACGMSYGGFFSVFLAGKLSDRIASIASVAGTILNTIPDTVISPNRPIAFLGIHGTNDNNVPYYGNQVSKSVQYVVDLFVDNNNCNTIPSITTLPDINPNDGSTVEHYIYSNGDKGTTVEHLKINNGRHTWPDENTNAQGVNRDVNGCQEIWKFFSRFDINGAIGSPINTDDILKKHDVSVFPNPAQNYIQVNSINQVKDVRIYNCLGQEFILPINYLNEKIEVDIRTIPIGVYFIFIDNDVRILRSSFLKNKNQ